MCGIAGFLGLSEPPLARQATLGAMLATLTHRGPDDEGAWHDRKSGLGIGMRRLSIVDLAGGHQPIWNEDRSIGIVFNGEIYNHVALRRELEQSGHVFCTRSDTEVLVHLYEERGPKLFERLQGMYGLAIVDLKRQQLLLARDPFGQKPLYLFRPRSGTLAFASETKALRAMPGWHGSVDEQSYFDYLTWLSLPAPRTHWQQVEKLAPGEWQVINLRDATLQGRGITPAIKFAPQGDLTSPDAAAPHLEAALRDSVQRHLEADVPVGLLLSGGSDSLAIGWAVSQIAPAPLHTFTAGFEGEDNEYEPARRTAELVGSIHHEIALPSEILEQNVEALIHYLDEPIGDPAAVAVLAICRAARPHVKVLLGGEGSDELFAGYAGRYAGLAGHAERSARLRGLLGWLPGRPRSFASSRIGRCLTQARVSPAEDLLTARVEGLGPTHPWARQHASHLLPMWRERSRVLADVLSLPESGSTLDLAQTLDLAWQLPESLLVKADRMSMGASIELRCPFLDPAVAAEAARIVPGARLDREDRVGKLPLRAMLAQHCPAEAARPKQGFPLPLGRWLRGPLADDVRSRLTNGKSAFVALVGSRAAESWCDGFMRGALSPHITYSLWLYERWRAGTRASPPPPSTASC